MTTTYQQLKKRKVTLPHTVPTVSISVVPRKHGLLVSLRLGFVLVCVVVVFQLLLVPLCKTSTQDVTTLLTSLNTGPVPQKTARLVSFFPVQTPRRLPENMPLQH